MESHRRRAREYDQQREWTAAQAELLRAAELAAQFLPDEDQVRLLISVLTDLARHLMVPEAASASADRSAAASRLFYSALPLDRALALARGVRTLDRAGELTIPILLLRMKIAVDLVDLSLAARTQKELELEFARRGLGFTAAVGAVTTRTELKMGVAQLRSVLKAREWTAPPDPESGTPRTP